MKFQIHIYFIGNLFISVKSCSHEKTYSTFVPKIIHSNARAEKTFQCNYQYRLEDTKGVTRSRKSKKHPAL